MKNADVQTISDRLIRLGETLAIGESVTAGRITATMSLSANATSFLQGGIIVYNLGQKTKQLNVDPIYAERVNCVSPGIATAMALEVAKMFCSQWGVGITGYAAPVPALKIRTCFAYYSIVRNNEILVSEKIETRLTGQARVQQYFVRRVVASFSQMLKE